MLAEIRFDKDWRTFTRGESYVFSPGVNLIVGDQGSGKSSMLELFRTHNPLLKDVISAKMDVEGELITTRHFDFERDNIRHRGRFSEDSNKFHAELAALWKSHGETNNAILGALRQSHNEIICMDEPDCALSIRSCHKLVKLMKELHEQQGCQIIAAVHNPVVIAAFPAVISLEHKRVMTSEQFIASQEMDIENG